MNISHKNIKAASFKPVDLIEGNKNIGVSLMGKYNLKIYYNIYYKKMFKFEAETGNLDLVQNENLIETDSFFCAVYLNLNEESFENATDCKSLCI